MFNLRYTRDMPKTLITILFLLFLVPAQAQTDSSTLLLKLSIKQATEVNHTFKFPLEQLKKVKKIEMNVPIAMVMKRLR